MHFAKKNREKDAQDDAVPASLSSSGTEADEDHLTSTKPRYGSFEPHVFSNPARAEHWMSVYEQARYECRHRVDPTFQWSAEAEKRVARKVILYKRTLSARDLAHGDSCDQIMSQAC